MRKPVVIIGAPRSGTNMLRDVLCRLPGYTTWPCDEINYIWRHGNVRFPSDEFTAEMARPAVAEYIRAAFRKRAQSGDVVVEKTCANSLRVPFVDAVIPDAHYVFIVRDGLDVVASAMKRWTAELDFGYLARKARFVPVSDLPYYGSRYLMNRLYRLFSGNQRLAFWGPQLAGMQEILQRHSLEQVCALQWKRCVDLAANAFAGSTGNRAVSVRYENFAADPGAELERILVFLGESFERDDISFATSIVRSSSLGKGRRELPRDVHDQTFPLIADTLSAHGYD